MSPLLLRYILQLYFMQPFNLNNVLPSVFQKLVAGVNLVMDEKFENLWEAVVAVSIALVKLHGTQFLLLKGQNTALFISKTHNEFL